MITFRKAIRFESLALVVIHDQDYVLVQEKGLLL